MSSAIRTAGAVTAVLAASAVAISIGGITLASAESAVATTGVNIRSGPGTSHDIVGGLAPGQRVSTTGEPENGWVTVRFNGSTGYISAEYLDIGGDTASSSPVTIFTEGTKVASAPLNVRTGPGENRDVTGYISQGQNVTLTGKQSGGYAEVLYGGERAWVSARYLVSAINGLPEQTNTKTATADLLIRTSADADFLIVTTVDEGTELQVTGNARNGYAQVIYNDARRWVTAEYLGNQAGSDSGAEQSDDRPEPKPKPDPKPEPEPKPKPDPEPEPKPEPKPKPDPKPEPKPDDSDSGSSDSGDSGGDSAGAGSYSGSSTAVSNGTWDRLAMCESSGDWSINTGNGFYGGLQFTLQTWRGFGGYGMPQDASRAEQIEVAERVLAVQGWGAWPACTSKLGLR